LVSKNDVLDTFLSMNLIREATTYLLVALKGNRKEEGPLQTKLLEINLLRGAPQVADAIMENEMFTCYDFRYIARLCEQAGLIQRALEHYSDLADVKRIMSSGATGINSEFIVGYFGSMSRDGSLEVMRAMLASQVPQNLNVVVQVAIKYSDTLGPECLIKIFEDFKSYEEMLHYLGAIVNISRSPMVHRKYIEVAAKMQQFKEVERVCRDSAVYDPIEVKNYLVEARLADPLPLIHVCDRHDFIEEMTAYLYTNHLLHYVEVYVQKLTPEKLRRVVEKLLDLDCNEDFVRNLLMLVGPTCPVDVLVAEVGSGIVGWNTCPLLFPASSISTSLSSVSSSFRWSVVNVSRCSSLGWRPAVHRAALT